MELKNALIAELINEGAATKKLIACLPAQGWDYKPHPKSMSMDDLANHIVGLIDWMRLIVEQDELDLSTFTPETVGQNTQELTALCDTFVASAQQALEKATNEDFAKSWTLKMGDYVIMSLPKSDAIRYVVNNHLYHHRGQLTVYLRLLDIKIPGLYGPSADEQ